MTSNAEYIKSVLFLVSYIVHKVKITFLCAYLVCGTYFTVLHELQNEVYARYLHNCYEVRFLYPSFNICNVSIM